MGRCVLGTHYVVSGATGFIGQHLVRRLVGRGIQVTALLRPSSNRAQVEALGARVAIADLERGDGLREALAGADAVLHLAGVTKARTAPEYERGNAEVTRLIARTLASQANPARLVLCSSLAAAGPSRIGQPLTEADVPNPVSTYGRSKLNAERAVREFSGTVPTVIVRPPIVYGPADKEVLPNLFPMLRLGLALKGGFGPKHFSIVHVEDVCSALESAADKGPTLRADDPASGVYFVSDGREHSWEDVCQQVAKAMGKRALRVLPVPNAVSYAVGLGSELQARLRGIVPILNRDKVREMRCEAWTCSPSRAAKAIGYAPAFDIERGMANAVEWYRREGLV